MNRQNVPDMPDLQTWLAAIDGPGGLSIVVQGGLSAGNVVETARHCEHWRVLFPAAEIILAISVTDLVIENADEQGLISDLAPVLVRRNGGLVRTALSRIRASCDKIVLSEGALPLPPIKTDTKINNVNLQIAAAKAGLARATGAYTLRVRSDLIFHDRSFLSFYHENYGLPRRARNAFTQRVMISELFTLNPFTLERMPFHYSDWFHFGLTSDVISIWDVAPMSLQDAVFYNVRPHPPGANRYERKFRVRIAVEQHVAFNHLKAVFPEIQLDFHTDHRSAEESMHVLLSDFLVCDLKGCGALFGKYEKAFRDRRMELLCITHREWRRLIEHPPGTSFREHYAEKSKQARRSILIREEPILRPVKFAVNAGKFIRARLAYAWRFARSATGL